MKANCSFLVLCVAKFMLLNNTSNLLEALCRTSQRKPVTDIGVLEECRYLLETTEQGVGQLLVNSWAPEELGEVKVSIDRN